MSRSERIELQPKKTPHFLGRLIADAAFAASMALTPVATRAQAESTGQPPISDVLPSDVGGSIIPPGSEVFPTEPPVDLLKPVGEVYYDRLDQGFQFVDKTSSFKVRLVPRDPKLEADYLEFVSAWRQQDPKNRLPSRTIFTNINDEVFTKYGARDYIAPVTSPFNPAEFLKIYRWALIDGRLVDGKPVAVVTEDGREIYERYTY